MYDRLTALIPKVGDQLFLTNEGKLDGTLASFFIYNFGKVKIK